MHKDLELRSGLQIKTDGTAWQRSDQELVRGAVAGEHFAELFFAHAKDEAIIAYVRELLG